MIKGHKDKRIENGKKTVSKVLLVARRMFGKQGFAKTSTSDIVKKACIIIFLQKKIFLKLYSE